ncbi:MAG: hypothetical protein WAK95_09590 [Desulfobacterales bacterium]
MLELTDMFFSGTGGSDAFDSFGFLSMSFAGSGGFDSINFFKVSKKPLRPSFSEGLFTDEAESALTGGHGAASNSSIAPAADKHRSRESYFIVNHRIRTINRNFPDMNCIQGAFTPEISNPARAGARPIGFKIKILAAGVGRRRITLAAAALYPRQNLYFKTI